MLLDLVCKLARIMIQKVAWYKYRDTYFTVSVTGPLGYYMLKVTSGFNFRGYHYDNSTKDPLTYKLIQRKPTIVPAVSLLFICADVEAKNKVTISEVTHLNILFVLDNMN